MDDRTATGLDLEAMLSAVQSALTATLGSELTVELGLPTLSLPEQRAAPGVIVSLGDVAEATGEVAWIWLDAALATNLVDRILGGRGQLGVATAAGLPSEAECGVLAYLAARGARVWPGRWVRDVYSTSQAAPAASFVWPVHVRWSAGSGMAFMGVVKPSHRASLDVQIGWLDALRSSDREALEVGDVLISEGLALSSTTRGLSGPCELRLPGFADSLQVSLEGTSVHGRRTARTKARDDELFVALYDLSLSPLDMATLTSGGSVALPRPPPDQVRLTQAGKPLALAQLVKVSGAVGVRIQALSHSEAHELDPLGQER